MKLLSNARLVGLLVLAVMFGAGRAGAVLNPAFVLTVSNVTFTASTTNVFFTNNPVYTYITISNSSPYVPNSALYVTNEFSEAVAFEGFVSNQFSPYLSEAAESSNTYVFTLPVVTTNPVSQIIFEWLPLSSGPVTNNLTVAISSSTNTASTSFVINQVYGGNADLAVASYIVSQAYITNDWVITNDALTYGVTVSNIGPSAVAGVLLTNTLPAGVGLLSASPGYAVSGANLVFSVGTLAVGQAASYQFTIQPTNPGSFTLTDGAGAGSTFDVDTTNNVAVETVNVTNYLNDSTLVAGTTSAQAVNLQNGLIEQLIGVTNTGAKAVQAVRLVVAGLTNQLYNACGTNGGLPFVTYPIALGSGNSVSFRLQYNPRLAFPFANSQLQAYEVPATVLNYAPPPAPNFFSYASNSVNFYRIQTVPATTLPSGMLLEFINPSASPTNKYTIVYGSNMNLTDARIATPAVSSSANRIQWIDYGPPDTISPPTSGSRYYRVLVNP